MKNNYFQTINLALTLILGIIGLTYLIHERSVTDNQITGLKKQLSSLSSNFASTTTSILKKENAVVPVVPAAKPEKTQDQLLTSAVAKVAPSVVSIVISQDVPKLQVTYENPFGNDPNFGGFDFQIPVYHQVGTTTQQVGAGSGFIVSTSGYILTNKHVASIADAEYTVLLSNGTQKNATVVYKDPNNDVAVLKVNGSGFTPVTLGDSSSLQLGQTVAAIGDALGQYSNSVSVGIISGLNRSIQPQDENGNTESLTGIIQTDAAINPGNSGGPLLDLNGEVVGVNVAAVQNSNSIGFSIPINMIKSVLSQFVK